MKNFRKVLGTIAIAICACICLGVVAEEVPVVEATGTVNIAEAFINGVELPAFGANVDTKGSIYIAKYGTPIKTNVSEYTGNITLINSNTHDIGLVWQIKGADGKWSNFTGEKFVKGEYRLTFAEYQDFYQGRDTETYRVVDTTKIVFNAGNVNWTSSTNFKNQMIAGLKGTNCKTLADLTYTVVEPVSAVGVSVTAPLGQKAPDKVATVVVKDAAGEVIENALSNEQVNVTWYEFDGENWVPMTTEVFRGGHVYAYEIDELVLADKLYKFADTTAYTYNELTKNQLTTDGLYAEYSLEYLEETGKVVKTLGQIDGLQFKFDADKDDVVAVTLGYMNLTAEEDYTLEDGCTLLTLTEAGLKKVRKLDVGTYVLRVDLANGSHTDAQLVINEPVVEENPKTGDNIVLYVVTGVVSLSGLAASALYLRKRFN